MWEDAVPEPSAYPADILRVVNNGDGVITTLLQRRNSRSTAAFHRRARRDDLAAACSAESHDRPELFKYGHPRRLLVLISSRYVFEVRKTFISPIIVLSIQITLSKK